jgi:hypothetical protein
MHVYFLSFYLVSLVAVCSPHHISASSYALHPLPFAVKSAILMMILYFPHAQVLLLQFMCLNFACGEWACYHAKYRAAEIPY